MRVCFSIGVLYAQLRDAEEGALPSVVPQLENQRQSVFRLHS